jgi:transposase
MSRHDLTDTQWTIIEPLIPKQKSDPGRKRNDARHTLKGILFVLKTGCTWDDMPRAYSSPATCWRRSRNWAADGTWEQIWRTLLSRLNAQGEIEWAQTFLDAVLYRRNRGIWGRQHEDRQRQSSEGRGRWTWLADRLIR